MTKIFKRKYIDKTFTYQFRDKVIHTDYYKDHLVAQLPLVMDEILSKKKKIHILDMAAGHGYTAVILSKYYQNNIEQLVIYDINPKAVKLARYNIIVNKCEIKKIDFRIGSLYEPLNYDETFDLIVSALPPVPILSSELALLPEDVKVHHWVESTAGITGRELLDEMILKTYDHLNPGGMVITSQADFQNATANTIEVMKQHGLTPQMRGIPKAQKLKNTKLTILRRDHIINLGYTFTKDIDGDEQFFIQTYIGVRCE